MGSAQGRRLPGIGSHHSARALTDEWLTPPDLLAKLGPFDLDPCSPVVRPWDTARHHLTVEDDGLSSGWHGRVWLNPPYSEIEPWMAKMAQREWGTALVFARAETRWWMEHVWPRASAILFMAKRVTFYRGDGTASKAGHNSGGPSALVAYGATDAHRLAISGIPGALVTGITMLPGV